MRVIFIIILLQIFKLEFVTSQNLNDCIISKWHRQIYNSDNSGNTFEVVGNEFIFFNSEKVFTVYTDSAYTISGHFLDYYNILDSNKLLISREESAWDEVPASWVNCTQYELSIGGSQPYLYERTEDFPFSLIQNLNQLEIIASENIFEDFLNKIIKSPCEPRLDVFNDKDGTKVGYLIEGDLVEVLEIEGEWAKVRYLKTDIEYWTYASCLK